MAPSLGPLSSMIQAPQTRPKRNNTKTVTANNHTDTSSGKSMASLPILQRRFIVAEAYSKAFAKQYHTGMILNPISALYPYCKSLPENTQF